jgi:hypothetical protein
MALSRVGDRNLTRQRAGCYPPPNEAKSLVLHHQLNVLGRKAPNRLVFRNFDQLDCASLYPAGLIRPSRYFSRDHGNTTPRGKIVFKV